MKLRHLLLIMALTTAPAIFTGCGTSQASETQKPEVVFSDSSSSSVDGQDVISIDDSSLPGGKLGITSSKSGAATERTGADGSKITVMIDAYGNKSEMRCFNNDSRVKCITLKTAANGNTSITVFGQNGVSKVISKDKLGDALNVSADEIAKAAELYESSQKVDITKMIPKKSEPVNLQPLPSSEFPIRPVQAPPPPIEEVQNTADEPPPSVEQSKPEFENQN